MTTITIDRAVVEQALESIDWLRHHLIQHHGCLHMDPTASGIPTWLNKNEATLRAALAEPEEDHELSAALGWAAGISEPVLDRKTLLRRVAEIATDMQAKTKRAWDVGYDCGLKAASERRLTDSEIGEIWFAAKIPGLTETQARVLIRAAEKMMRGEQP